MRGIVRAWLRASLQGTMALGLIMIALVWAGTALHLYGEKRAALRVAFQETSNLARSFDEHISRLVRSYDDKLLVMRELYSRSPGLFAADGENGPVEPIVTTFRYGIFDAHGDLIASSFGTSSRLNVADREHFKAFAESTDDNLHIGRPIRERTTGKVMIHLARRLIAPDGSFAGTIVASLDPAQLIKFYETIDIGERGAISLFGTDGYLRAIRGSQRDISQLPPSRGVLERLHERPSGSYVNDGRFDGVVRAISYRKVGDLPLAVLVGMAEEDVFAHFRRTAWMLISAAAAITLFVAIVMILSVRHRRRLEIAYEALRRGELNARESKDRLRTTLENIDQGILMVDATGTVQVLNRRMIELVDLPPDWMQGQRKLKDMLDYLWQRGEFDNNDFDADVRAMLLGDGLDTRVARYERKRQNGTVLEVRTTATPEGGLVRTFTDITERKHAEARIAAMARHDDLTGLANRVLFREKVEQALRHCAREGDGFALLMLDLDRFKPINDALGHQIGDCVLKELGLRLRQCARANDSVARIGGDEFAILQSSARNEQDAARLARKILRAVERPVEVMGHTLTCGASIGVAFGPRDAAEYDALMSLADTALYRAKFAGRQCFRFAAEAQGAAVPSPSLAVAS